MRDRDEISAVAKPDRAVASKRIGLRAIGQSKRIGFLFNHDQIHQIAHSLPIAFAMAEQGGPFEVVIASTSAKLRQEIERLAGSLQRRITLVDLALTSPVSRSLVTMLGKLVPAYKILIYRDNLEFFRSLDILVVSERTSLLLKSLYGLDRPLMILADHGAGDRAIGFGHKTAMFDHILAAGPKIRDRLVRDAGVDPARLTITGYPKFDACLGEGSPLPMQSNGKPTVLYNPHVSPHLSSWFGMGARVLEHFLDSDLYNLIFAPHMMLFQRSVTVTIDKLRVARTGAIAPKFREAAHFHIDTGSVASTDMSYVRAADIYLGDVSSQVYEFLKTPRPCVFLNAHRHAWEGDPNFAHWQAGPVIETVDRLDAALDRAVRDHGHLYRPIQEKLFGYTFDLAAEPSAQRAARAILEIASTQL
ncbi:glycerophosphotransferase [soil metagenome]